MNCKQCDTPLPEGVTFCPNCGARIEASSSGMPTISFRGNEQPSPEAPTVAASGRSFDLPPTAAAAPAATQPPAYQPPASQPSYGGYVPPTQPTSTAAIVSLVAGIVAWVFMPFIGAIVAVVAGHMARREIGSSNGQLGGGGMATAGLILGYIQIGITLLIFCAIVGLGILALLGTST